MTSSIAVLGLVDLITEWCLEWQSLLFTFFFSDRSSMQRSASTPRVIGQSSAIRQALGHLPPTPSALTMHPVTEQHTSARTNMKLLEKVCRVLSRTQRLSRIVEGRS